MTVCKDLSYEIPISVSPAHSFSTPQNTTAPTFFNFGAGTIDGGRYDNEQSPYNPVTATATSALGNASSDVGVGGASSKTLIILSVLGMATLLGAVYLYKH